MSDFRVAFRVKPLAGHSVVPQGRGGWDYIEVLVVDDTNEQRNVLVDYDAVAGVLRDLFDGRADMAATAGYGVMWTLEVQDRGL